jgi:hypothetical protein
MDLLQGRLTDGDEEILNLDTNFSLKQLNINLLTYPYKQLT